MKKAPHISARGYTDSMGVAELLIAKLVVVAILAFIAGFMGLFR